MAVIETWFEQDLQKPVKVRYIDGNLFSHNDNGNRIGVVVTNNGEAVTLTGTVSGYAVLADGTTVPCTGTRSGNKASILVPAAAYSPGSILISIFLTDGTTVTTLAALSSSVIMARTGNQIDPGSVVTDWTNTINAAMQSVETAAANLGNIVATPYANLTFPVPLGKYTIYNNGLYRCISPIASSEAWTAAHWTNVKLGDDVAELKRTLNVIQTIPHTVVYTNGIANNLIKKHEMIHGYYINASGIQTKSSSWNCTDFIDISEYEKVTLSGGAGSFAFYDASYNFISPSGSGNQNGYTVPSGAKYIRVSANNTNIETVMLNGGTTAKTYDDGYFILDTNDIKTQLNKLKTSLQFLGTVQADTYSTVLPDANGAVNAGYYLLNFSAGSTSIPSNLPFNKFNGSMHLLEVYQSTGAYRRQVYYEALADTVLIHTRYSASSGTSWSSWITVNGDIVTKFPDIEKKIPIIENDPYNIVYTSGKPNNLIVINELIHGEYINASGGVSTASTFNRTDYIDISAYEKITMSGNIGNSAFYDTNKDFITGATISSNGTFTVPSGAVYIRCSVSDTNKGTAMLNGGTSALPYDNGTVIVDVKALKRKTIIVAKSGGGDFTSLTEAVRSNVNNICDFYVRPGEYDLFTEMKAYYGDSYFDFTSTVYDEGLEIKNGSRFFLDANAVVKFNYTGSNQYVIQFFSPFKFSRDGGELHGGQIICSNCRYAIHDDCYTSDYDNRITDGVYIYYRSDRGVAIGGGLGKSSHVELKNCYVDSNTIGAAYGVFYHNNSQSADALNYVNIHDNYFTADIVIEPFGPSEHISRALVSNNKARDVRHYQPSAQDNPPDIDNFEMIAWNNVTTV